MNSLVRSFLAKSTFLWIVGLFLVANFAWEFIRPLQNVPHTSQPNLELSKAALRFKMDELKASKRPDIMIIGSSLPMCAFFYTERPPFFDLNEGAKIRDLKLNLLQSYPKAGYFTAKIKELTGKELQVYNFAGAACMVSDTKLVMERTLAANKKPEIIIYGIGLRDFVDNINPPPGDTPYYKALCNAPFVLKNLGQLMRFHSFTDLSICAICKLYEMRNEVRISAEHYACVALKHPSTIELAFIISDLNKQLKAKQDAALTKKLPPEIKPQLIVTTGTQAEKQTDKLAAAAGNAAKEPPPKSPGASAQPKLEAETKAAQPSSTLSTLDYKQRYTPANYERLNAEMNELQGLIASCKKQGIKLVLINMPVSQGHKTLSPPGLRQKYLSKLRAIAPAATLFLDYENETLADKDFFDTVHLNGTGSAEFVDELTKRLHNAGLF